jgi:hypothetical protein
MVSRKARHAFFVRTEGFPISTVTRTGSKSIAKVLMLAARLSLNKITRKRVLFMSQESPQKKPLLPPNKPQPKRRQKDPEKKDSGVWIFAVVLFVIFLIVANPANLKNKTAQQMTYGAFFFFG